MAGRRLAVDKQRATAPAFRARDAGSGATICCGQLAQGGSSGAYGTYIGPGTTPLVRPLQVLVRDAPELSSSDVVL